MGLLLTGAKPSMLSSEAPEDVDCLEAPKLASSGAQASPSAAAGLAAVGAASLTELFITQGTPDVLAVTSKDPG